MRESTQTTGTDKEPPVAIRAGYAEHLGCYEIKAHLQAKTKAGTGGEVLANTQLERRSWQQIHKTTSRTTHQRKLKELTNTGNYTLNQ